MPHIIVTRITHDMIRARSIGNFRDNSTKLHNGNIQIYVDNDVLDYINEQRIGAETDNDVVQRIVSTKQ